PKTQLRDRVIVRTIGRSWGSASKGQKAKRVTPATEELRQRIENSE
ncbi:15800_t:CDS:1, partial [Acaulospora colombiana]